MFYIFYTFSITNMLSQIFFLIARISLSSITNNNKFRSYTIILKLHIYVH